MKLLSILPLAFAAAPARAGLRQLQSPHFTNVKDAIQYAVDNITSIVEADKRIGYKFVRLGFHDCVGGCDGCVDLLNPDNKGLDVPINILSDIVTNCAVLNITRADIWALSAMVSVDLLKSEPDVVFPFNWYGRPTCDQLQAQFPCKAGNCGATRGPERNLPSPNFDTKQVLTYFKDQFGFTTSQTVALMGVHAIGLVTRTNSGFVGQGWSKSTSILNNQYYKALVGPNNTLQSRIKQTHLWQHREIVNTDIVDMPNRHQWTFDNLIMLNSDIALVRNFTGRMNTTSGKVLCDFRGVRRCPAARTTILLMQKFRNDNLHWLTEFSNVMKLMLEYPVDTSTLSCSVDGLCHLPPR